MPFRHGYHDRIERTAQGTRLRRLAFPALCALSVAAGMLACGPTDASRIPRTNMITGGTGSDWYRIGSAISERANASFPGQPLTAVPGAGGISNPARVGQLPGDFGLSFVPFLRAAYVGDAPYRRAFTDLRHVATLLQNRLHLIASDRIGLRSLGDIASRRLRVRIGTGPPGSAEEFLLREALAVHAITYDDIRSWGGRIDLLGSGERTDLYRDAHVDLIAFNAIDPSPMILELLLSHRGEFVPLDAEVREALVERWQVKAVAIEAGRYPGQDVEVPTVGLDFGVFTTADVDEQLVYEVTRGIAENRDYLATVHSGFRTWNASGMPFSGGVPVHPGAIRYYRERGWPTQ